MSEKLKPCPFCGGEAKVNTMKWVGGYTATALCKNEPNAHYLNTWDEDEAKAVERITKAWNTRTERTSHKVRAWEDSPLGEGYGGYVLICSECGEWIANDGEDGPDDGPNYCFNCGAKVEKRRAVDEQI